MTEQELDRIWNAVEKWLEDNPPNLYYVSYDDHLDDEGVNEVLFGETDRLIMDLFEGWSDSAYDEAQRVLSEMMTDLGVSEEEVEDLNANSLIDLTSRIYDADKSDLIGDLVNNALPTLFRVPIVPFDLYSQNDLIEKVKALGVDTTDWFEWEEHTEQKYWGGAALVFYGCPQDFYDKEWNSRVTVKGGVVWAGAGVWVEGSGLALNPVEPITVRLGDIRVDDYADGFSTDEVFGFVRPALSAEIEISEA